jgi:hypothetical protein
MAKDMPMVRNRIRRRLRGFAAAPGGRCLSMIVSRDAI